MKVSKAVTILSILVALLALGQSAAGLFWTGGGEPYSFINLHGQTIPMFGQGIYRDNPSFNVPILRGSDAVTLFLFVPLLVAAILWYRRGSLRAQLFLSGVLAIFLYTGASMSLGVTYNPLFLVYTALFSTSLFAFLLVMKEIDLKDLAARVPSTAPRMGFAILLFVAGLGLVFAWLPDILVGLPQGWNAVIGSYTTIVTDVLDLGIILPAAVLSGILLLRRDPTGYLLASILTIMLILIGVVVTAQTIAQSLAGINLGMGEFIGKAGSFLLLSLIGLWLQIRFFRSVSTSRGPTKVSLARGRA